MITLSGVTKHYDSHAAVDAVSFSVQEGETLVLLGTSGCGKTTTLRMINRLTVPDSGTITINGTEVKEAAPELLRRSIGYAMQQNGLFPHYTVLENIAVVPQLLQWPAAQIRTRVLALMEQLHLPAASFAHKYPHQLSGGQQQRVGLARALAGNAPVLLMDEPFGALDPVTRLMVRKDFMELEEISKKTIVLVTHDVTEAFEMGDRICLMNKGKVEQIGTPAALLFSPASPFVQSFFDSHRGLLEWNLVTVKDLWAWLPEQLNNVTTEKIWPAAINCWQVLQLLTGNETMMSLQCQQQVKTVSRQSLLEAFSHYKASQQLH